MLGLEEKRRVLLAAHKENRASLKSIFQRRHLEEWEVVEADSFTQARFVLQFDPCEVLLIHQDLFDAEGGQGLSWLVWNRNLPVVFLSATGGAASTRAYELGASLCLPMEEALAHPMLLAQVLDRALHWHQIETGLQTTREKLNESRRHVDRLVNVIWRISPTNGDSSWFTQRHMMERLQEELARAERHQVPLTVALGELNIHQTEADGPLPRWAVEAIIRGKRRCDVAGEYGPYGFLLLMVHTQKEGGVTCIRRLQKVIEHPLQESPGPHAPPRAFFGVTTTTDNRRTPATLLRAAEEGLEAARQQQERIVAN
jgi:GGDEF domain-containing protein